MELFRLLPDYYETNETMKMIQELLSRETDLLEKQESGTVDQCFAPSATFALNRYETILGLPVESGKPVQYRRERIKSKSVGAGTTTKELIEHISESFTGAEVEVTEHFSEYTVTIKFIGTSGIPGNIEDVKQAIEEAIPAHLKVVYEYIFTTYKEAGAYTHKALAAYTHGEIRNRVDGKGIG